MNSLVAITIVFVVFAIGDLLATKTKSIVSMLFTVSVVFMVAFWLGLPTTIFEDSTLLATGKLSVVFLLTHMGTLINFKQLKEQWRTVLIAASGILGIAILLLAVVGSLLGFEVALVAAPPIAGGVIAGLLMSDAATAIGAPDLAILATILVVIQGFVGYPVASLALKKEARLISQKYHAGEITLLKPKETTNLKNTKKKPLDFIPEKYKSSNVYLAKVALVALLAYFLTNLQISLIGSAIIDQNIMALLLGVIFSELGFLENDILTNSNSFGYLMASLTVLILSSLTQATPQLLWNLLPAILLALLMGSIGIFILSSLVGRFLKISPWMSTAIGISALFGFPGTFIVTEEVASAESETAEEKEVLIQNMMPQMLVAGFITVSIGSVILAGIFAPLLVNLFG